VLSSHPTYQEPTVKKRRHNVIHDTSSSDEVPPAAVESNDEHVCVSHVATPQEILVEQQVSPTVHYQGIFTHRHSKKCTCMRCAKRCKYVQIQSKHVGLTSSGTTGSSGSDIDDFICSQEEQFSAKEYDELELMFPISAKRLTFFKKRK
jgi:hypothetical protein